MRIIVIGASRLGEAVVSQLLDNGHNIVLVDRSRERLDDVSDRLDCGFIEGDGTLPRTLRDAYGDGADALMLMTNQDDVNILAAVVGQSIGFQRVVLQIVQSQLLEVCEELGFEDVVTPHTTVASSIAHSLENEERVWSQLGIIEGVHFTTYPVPEELVGKTLDELDMPRSARAVAIARTEEDAILDADEKLKEGDKVLVAAGSNVGEGLRKMFGAQED
ncbi:MULTISPECIES: potassium channel family protein [unclassified Roseovarius]|uniref:potassium channel family protein n=1 Tax=unclassified Roseovarius TaxID=2614913 RepID=UPI00273E754F|nr:TrkA family potassium uptake protein [Roseovarius sp. MMSF_3350]